MNNVVIENMVMKAIAIYDVVMSNVTKSNVYT
jgi:hypothetical protein